MNLLITAGAASASMDAYRAVVSSPGPRLISKIAAFAFHRGHTLTLLSSTREILDDLPTTELDPNLIQFIPFRTSDEFHSLLPRLLKESTPDAILHAATIPDYIPAGVFVPEEGTVFHPRSREWVTEGGTVKFVEQRANIAQSEPEQWVRLVRAPRIIDRLKTQWGYTDSLVLLRVEPDCSDHELVEAGELIRSRACADLLITTTVSGEALWAFVGPVDGRYVRVVRRELTEQLVLQLEDWHRAGVANG